jgi:hypothetical protein
MHKAACLCLHLQDERQRRGVMQPVKLLTYMYASRHVPCRWIVAVVCLILLVVFNIVFVKMFVGSRVLSDGRNIKHPGEQSASL